ncbi:hypothetical protein FRC10_011933, partial [Ceratobasidium sp. 414]
MDYEHGSILGDTALHHAPPSAHEPAQSPAQVPAPAPAPVVEVPPTAPAARTRS